MKFIRTSLLTVFFLVAGAGLCLADFSEDWEGVWEYDTDIWDCTINQLIWSTTSLDTICAGDEFEPPDDPQFDPDCTGTYNGTEIHVECDATIEVEPGCFGDMHIVLDQTRNGETFTGTQTITTTYSGTCTYEDTCMRTEFVATRIDSDPESCISTAATNLSWGTLKGVYR